jgi:hypothetical protein
MHTPYTAQIDIYTDNLESASRIAVITHINACTAQIDIYTDNLEPASRIVVITQINAYTIHRTNRYIHRPLQAT